MGPALLRQKGTNRFRSTQRQTVQYSSVCLLSCWLLQSKVSNPQSSFPICFDTTSRLEELVQSLNSTSGLSSVLSWPVSLVKNRPMQGKQRFWVGLE